MRSRTTVPGLLLRHLRQLRGPAVGVALLTALVATVLVAVPVSTGAVEEAELRQGLTDAPPSARQLLAGLSGPPRPGSDAEDPYAGFEDRLEAVRQQLPERVRRAASPARWSSTSLALPYEAPGAVTVPPQALTQAALLLDPSGAGEVRMVDGEWPQGRSTTGGPLAWALSVPTAEALDWPVGEERAGLVLSGTWQPRDAGSDYWALQPSVIEPFVRDDGNSPLVITGTGFVDPVGFQELPTSGVVQTQVRYPLTLPDQEARDVGPLVAQLRQVASRPYSAGTDVDLTLQVGAIEVLEDARSRVLAAQAVMTATGVGPVGVGLIALLLALRSLAQRRASWTAALARRGAAPRTLRLLGALEGLLLALPVTVVVGLAVATGAGPLPGAALAAPGLLALVPPVVLAAWPLCEAPRRVPPDGARRRTAEAVVVLTALLAAVVLATTRATPRVDGLLLTAPLLLPAAACVLLLRAYAPASRTLRTTLTRIGSRRRDPDVGSWLGSLDSRETARQVSTLLTLVTSVTMAVLSLVLWDTLPAGAAPLADGVRRGLLAGVAVAGTTAALALVLAQLAAAEERAQGVVVLRALGVSSSQRRRWLLTGQLPPAVAATGLGAVLGLLLGSGLVRAVDLAGLVGGGDQPAAAYPWIWVALVAGAHLLVVALLTLGGLRLAERRDTIDLVRSGVA